MDNLGPLKVELLCYYPIPIARCLVVAEGLGGIAGRRADRRSSYSKSKWQRYCRPLQ